MIRVRRPFFLAGRVPPSKSWLNRALILRSLHPGVRIVEWEPSDMDGDDVVHLSGALAALQAGQKEFNIGESGTGFRFLIARLSVEKGVFKVRGSRRLLERPHRVLFDALAKVQTTIVNLDPETIEVTANGWPNHAVEIEIDASESSQFASALKLAASVFPHDFKLTMTGVTRSLGYLEMTEALIEAVKLGRKVLAAETDASSVATLATLAVAASQVAEKKALKQVASNSAAELANDCAKTLSQLRELVERTHQPDRVIFQFLDRMLVEDSFKAIDADLEGAPDLFPCLAAMSAFATGTSKFYGAPHLRLKESDRISGIARLFDTVGISYRERDDGMEVDGITPAQADAFAKRRKQGLAFSFNPLSDHRLAFAAAVLAAGGVPIEVTNRGVVAKSLPLFWSMIEGDAPRVAIIGHRGTGKTEAAKRWAFELGTRSILIDLDREIERLAGKSTQDIFETLGEVEFRWFERQAWREIDRETRNATEAVIVACGAGFDPSLIDDSWTRVWLRRATDKDGRIFTDRPRLDQTLDPLTESKLRMQSREPRFARYADRVFEIGEGRRDPSEMAWVSDLFDHDGANSSHDGGGIAFLGGAVTLLSHHNVAETCERWIRWGVSRIEIRNDLWSPTSEVAAWEFFGKLPLEKLLISFRAVGEIDSTLANLGRWLGGERFAVDWPLDQSTTVPPRIVDMARAKQIDLVLSLHGSTSNVSVADLNEHEFRFQKLGVPVTFKVALETPDFKVLHPYHKWMMTSPQTRILLPMTPKTVASKPLSPKKINEILVTPPRWQWYRAWIGARASLGLNFWREDDGSSLDQPTFSQWWRRRRFQTADARTGNEFAAILGDPVLHSRTPLEHDEYFAKLKMPVFAIPMKRENIAIALPLLIDLGLRAAAVTAPLKEEIVPGQAVNTLAIKAKSQLRTTSTDNVGFAKLWQDTFELRMRLNLTVGQTGEGVVVWGGGGVLKSIATVLPQAVFYSASAGTPRDPNRPFEDFAKGPDVVVWGAGETRGAWPSSWRPRLLIDLSYTENSLGRAVALESGARYVSGLLMFEAQAEAQQAFWSESSLN